MALSVARELDRQHLSAAGRVGCVAVGAELVEVPVARLVLTLGIRVIDAAVRDVEEMVRRVVGREGHREQAVIAARIQIVDERLDVEEGGGVPALGELDPPRLLDHEQAVGITRIRGHVGRPVEAPHLLERQRARARRGGQSRGLRGMP